MFATISSSGIVVFNEISTNVLNSVSELNGPVQKLVSDINEVCNHNKDNKDGSRRVTGSFRQQDTTLDITGAQLEISGDDEPKTTELDCEISEDVEGWHGGRYEIRTAGPQDQMFKFNTR
ncbi:hypothetical protein [Candidatus Nanohalobium constans]|nr:hypothetical protein [Candidatus Nanohalobium constans]